MQTSYSGCISPKKNQMEKLKNLTEDNSELKLIDYGYGAKNTHGLPGSVLILFPLSNYSKEKIININSLTIFL